MTDGTIQNGTGKSGSRWLKNSYDKPVAEAMNLIPEQGSLCWDNEGEGL